MFSRLDPILALFGALIILILSCLAALPYISSSQANISLEALKNDAAKEQAYNRVLSLLKDAETGQRGFLIGNDDSFLEPYHTGTAGMSAALENLRRLAASEQERAIVAHIAELSRAKLSEMDKTIRLKIEGDTQTAIAIVASKRGKRLMDELRVQLASQLDRLAERRKELRDDLTTSLRYNSALGIGASLASLVLFGGVVYVVTRSLNEQARAAKNAQIMAEANAKLAQQSEIRAKRMSTTASMLQTLDSIKSPSELARVLPVYLRKLLPGTAGAVYIYRNSRDVLELKANWGNQTALAPTATPSDCWGLRLGRAHVATPQNDLCCSHGAMPFDSHATQTCIPMISQGDVIGVLVITGHQLDGNANDSNQITTIAEQLSLAISNVTLRDTLRHQSTIDTLTGLYNRRFFDESLKRELARAQRSCSPCSVVMVDLDHFKRVNDTFGHDGGDLVLQAVSRAILQRVRASDVVCRYGGEELVIMLPDCEVDEAAKCAEVIRISLGSIVIQHARQTISGISASFGVAQWPGHGAGRQDLLQSADRALYLAKNTGRNKVVTAEFTLDAAHTSIVS